MQDRELPKKPDSLFSLSQEDLEVEEASAPQPAPQPAPELHHDTRQFSGEAVVDEEIRPQERGRVYFRSSWWFARCNSDITLPPGARVEVMGLETENMTLLVVPYGEKKEPVEPIILEPDSILSPEQEPN
ncbi:NfeD family protein [Oscillatoria sp. FACHB-1406]|uniref:NfeD family protein n=1 Tax=Oscillatoria sp. FACHB-1406 TaxID=2692846 RepID=UPI00168453EF|nr:NfeD family protein [Oscillatoria sp. FACHB-1406]MBD2576155.1 NfeD family protein [Oscillatoria sp. FACHB-1406]